MWRITHVGLSQSLKIIEKQYIDLFCIESNQFNKEIKRLLKEISENCLGSKTLAIIPNDKEMKRLFLRYGCDDYLSTPYNCEDLILRCKKLTQCISTNYSIVYERSSLRYERKFNRVMYENTYIPLTPTEILIIKLLIRNSVVSKNHIQKYLKNKVGKNCSDEYINVLIHRTKRKIKLCTGRNLIRNKYSYGYYLV